MAGNAWTESDDDTLMDDVINAIKLVYDPEIPLNVYDLGLIYKIIIKDRSVAVTMTLTNPACPSGGEIAEAIYRSIELVSGVLSVSIKITFDPPYTKEMMSEA